MCKPILTLLKHVVYPSSTVTDIVIPVVPYAFEGALGEPVHENPKQYELHNSHSL